MTLQPAPRHCRRCIRQQCPASYLTCAYIDHSILLKKLEHYGIRGLALHWFNNYLHGRLQYVNINGIDSSLKTITSGVPQGSILGPLLFLIYINDFVNSSHIFHKVMFADDTNLFTSHRNPIILQDIVNTKLVKVDTWFKCNKLSLNIDKTHFILFRSDKKNINPQLLHITINGQELKREKCTTFLGVIIDEFINFKPHIDHLTKKLSKYAGLFFRLRHFLPLSALLTLYKTLFEPHLSYCNIVWSNTCPSYFLKLERLQKKAIRALSWSPFNSHTPPIFHRLNLLRLTEFNTFQNGCTMFQVVHGLSPRLSDLLPISRPQHQYDTRYKHHITGKKRRLKCTSRSIACRGPELWNHLDEDLKLPYSFSIFKSKLKTTLLQTYAYK